MVSMNLTNEHLNKEHLKATADLSEEGWLETFD